jgi:hypothetical protein
MVQARFRRSDADVVINTFAFDVGIGSDLGGSMNNIRQRLDAFYFSLTGTQTGTVASNMAGSIVGLSYYARAADQPLGSAGLEVESDLFLKPTEAARMPPDSAIALSYRSGSAPTKRQRGRIYIGPLKSAGVMSTLGLITLTYRQNLGKAAEGLASASPSAPIRWVIASRAGNSASLIDRGYVDEHFDTQRRRDPGTEFFGRREDGWGTDSVPPTV